MGSQSGCCTGSFGYKTPAGSDRKRGLVGSIGCYSWPTDRLNRRKAPKINGRKVFQEQEVYITDPQEKKDLAQDDQDDANIIEWCIHIVRQKSLSESRARPVSFDAQFAPDSRKKFKTGNGPRKKFLEAIYCFFGPHLVREHIPQVKFVQTSCLASATSTIVTLPPSYKNIYMPYIITYIKSLYKDIYILIHTVLLSSTVWVCIKTYIKNQSSKII